MCVAAFGQELKTIDPASLRSLHTETAVARFRLAFDEGGAPRSGTSRMLAVASLYHSAAVASTVAGLDQRAHAVVPA